MIPELEYKKKYHPNYTGLELVVECFVQRKDFAGNFRDYMLDVITKSGEKKGVRPVVLFLHGGGFLAPSDRRQAYISTFARDLTGEGYVVVSPDYPVFSDQTAYDLAGGEIAAYGAVGETVHQAYCYLAANAQRLGLDMGRVAIIGGSAGGMAAFYAISEYSDLYKAFVNCWGPPLVVPDLSRFPPTLSIHGTRDHLVDYSREIPIQERLEAARIPHRMITLEGEGHTPLHRYCDFFPEIQALFRQYL